jgi:hypothetical protein
MWWHTSDQPLAFSFFGGDMDAFEEIVTGLFRQNGFWTWNSYKVDLSLDDKRKLGKRTIPRPEIDILAYTPRGTSPGSLISAEENTLLWVECKSFLDSQGVTADAFKNKDSDAARRYKIFTDDEYREVVSERLKEQVNQSGLVLPEVKLCYCLVAGKIDRNSHRELSDIFNKRGWLLYDADWLSTGLEKLSQSNYENDIATVVSKLLLRK